MNVENHVYNAKNVLDLAREAIAQGNYDTALALLAKGWTDYRELIAHVWELKKASMLPAKR